MLISQINPIHYSLNYSQKMNEKLTYKVKIKENYTRTDGTSALYVQLFLKKKKKIFPLNLSIPIACFDKAKQRVNSKFANHKDYNLLIEKFLSDINTIGRKDFNL